MSSNLSVASNLMLDDEDHRPQCHYLPGDFVTQVYSHMGDVRVMDRFLTKQQIIEHRQYLVCIRCGRPCAGTCGA
jgi:hypothetical protein